MADKSSHRIRNEIIGGTIATVIGGLLLSLILPVRKVIVKIVHSCWEGILWGWSALIARYSVPGWLWVLILVLSSLGIIRLYFAFFHKENTEQEFTKYREDFISGAKWRWTWEKNNIVRLWCYCPDCDAQLVYNDEYNYLERRQDTVFICEHCNNRVVAKIDGGNKDYALSFVHREILRRLRTGEYEKKIAR